MKIVKTVAQLAAELNQNKGSLGFVPTMGALHEGHVSLVKQARQHNDRVVVSVFVNPTQFNDAKDLEKYPRTLEADAALLEQAGADVVFAPSVEEIYPNKESYTITHERLLALTSVMEGAHRPGHFDGVVQVVGRLFDLVRPMRAYFGEKDYQQVAIIKMMVAIDKRDLTIVTCPIIRAADGLALSSRNTLLSPDERAAAPNIYKVLAGIRIAIEAGERDYRKAEKEAILQIDKNRYLCTQYIEIVDAVTLQKADQTTKDVRICAAVMCGAVRLIDNV